MTALDTFFAQRAANAGFDCPCCRSRGLDADDMVLSGNRLWSQRSFNAAYVRYRGPICVACMDDHIWTQDGAFVPRDKATQVCNSLFSAGERDCLVRSQ